MSEQIKVTEEELNSIKSIQEEYNKKIVEFGQIGIQIFDNQVKLEESKQIESQLKEALKALRVKEQELAQSFSNKYGNGKLNTETGIFEKMQ